LNKNETTVKYAKTWGLNNKSLNDQWVIEKIRREIKTLQESNENDNTTTRTCGMQ
jgi:hypothetical protein